MPDNTTPLHWYSSLRVRLAALLSLALLPIGLIAVLQTKSVSDKAQENAELALLVLTETAALRERILIQRAFGAASVFTSQPRFLATEGNTCSAMLSEFVLKSPTFSFAGFAPLSGKMTCSSARKPIDLSDSKAFQRAVADARQRVDVNIGTQMGGPSVVTVSDPVMLNGELIGFMQVSIPHSKIDEAIEKLDAPALVDIVTFNGAGEVLTTRTNVNEAASRLPLDINLAVFSRTSASFSTEGVDGAQYLYTVVPIESGQFFVLGIWDPEIGLAQRADVLFPTSLFPVLMWVISLAVSLFAVHRLVSRHVNKLRSQMVRFARDREMPAQTTAPEMPTELASIHRSFVLMAESILHDEAAIEDAMRQKNILMKEVHHRVKNNLQLISSILNMQIRDAEHTETKQILRRMQDRVLSLSTIHKDLYQTSNAGLVDMGASCARLSTKAPTSAPKARSTSASTPTLTMCCSTRTKPCQCRFLRPKSPPTR
ncbi:sensor histidine kinase [Rhodobacteraceae bacterium D3-12]|nr:sensor histidine kinase [Rhodobacteraceae bacterium D3-12]